MSLNNFVHLNVRSDMSLLEGCATMKSFCELASKRKHTAIGFTELGTMRGCVDFAAIAKRLNMKAIYGVTVQVCGDMHRKGITPDERAAITAPLKPSEYAAAIERWESERGIMDADTLTLWAKDQDGLRNLFRLTSLAWIDGFYYVPRVDIAAILKHRKGVMVGTGDTKSLIYRRAIQGQRKGALELAGKLWDAFGPDDFWVELQPHGLLEQAKANDFALTLLKRFKGSRPLATQGARYLSEGDDKYQRMLSAIGPGKGQELESCGLPGGSFWLKTRKQMFGAFRRSHKDVPSSIVKQALANTKVLAAACTAVIEPDKLSFKLPAVHVPKRFKGDIHKYLRNLCVKGWKWRGVTERIEVYARKRGIKSSAAEQIYIKRMNHELKALKLQGFAPYILMTYELYAWTRAQGIAGGPGRGSAAGSIVNFLLGITAVDPIEYGLLFERFISPARIDMPDIDMDFEDARRQEVIDHLRDKYGGECVSQIATWGNLKGKSVLRDTSRVLKVPLAAVKDVSDAVMERSSGDERADMCVADSFAEFTVCKKFNKQYPEVLEYSSHLEGLAKSLGTHAAGVICSPSPLIDQCPMETRKDSHGDGRITVTGLSMLGAASLGLLKMDVLGLRTMTILRIAVEEIARRHKRVIDLETITLDDFETLKGFTDHDFIGVFQYDSASADRICRGIIFDRFDDVIAMTALNRPGTSRSGLADQYIKRKKNPELVKKIDMHKSVSKLTADTLGIIVYQEHVIEIFTKIAGFDAGRADKLRSKIGKRVGVEALRKDASDFVEGAMKTTGMKQAAAEKIMSAIERFAEYSFNKSHATCYAMIGFWCMYLKKHYPIEFFVGNLQRQSDHSSLQRLIKCARAHDVKILPPHVSYSGVEFQIDDGANAIRGSLVDIKGVGNKAASSIMTNAPYKDLWDFLARVDRRTVNKGVCRSLAFAGAFGKMIHNLKFLIERYDVIWDEIKKAGKVDKDTGAWKWNEERRLKLDTILRRSKAHEDYGPEERTLYASKVNPLAFGKHPISVYGKFLGEHVKHPITSMGSDKFFKNADASKTGGVFIAGMITAIKLAQVGDWHTGPPPSDEEKRRMQWGKQFAQINIEDESGTDVRCKLEWDLLEEYQSVLDAGVGTPVVAQVVCNARYESTKIHFMIDLEVYRKQVAGSETLTIWEKIMAGKHPALTRPWRNERLKALAFKDIEQTKTKLAKAPNGAAMRVVGIVTNSRQKPDKNGKLMGFFGIAGVRGFVDCLCFASNWLEIRKAIKIGNLVSIELQLDDRTAIYNGGHVRLIETSGGQNRKIVKSKAT